MAPRHPSRLFTLLLLMLASAAIFAAALAIGPLGVAWQDALRVTFFPDGSAAAEVVWQLRLPRAVGAFACGGLLALAGTLMQVLLRNPLADPYVLGISGGAAVGALLAMLSGATLLGVNGAAALGALAIMLLVLGVSHGAGSWTPTRLLLTGVMLSAGCGAIVALLLTVSPGSRLPGMLFWLMGDVSGIATPWLPAGALGVALIALWPFARELNVLSQGALSAQALGVPVRTLRIAIYLIASLLTAIAVTTAGAIGFVGLVAPHALRLIAGGDHRFLLPAAMLTGGSLVTLADTLARTVASPLQLPVGVVMALIGVPVFLWLLARSGGRS